MSWVQGARRDYPASLQIKDDKTAQVRFNAEPDVQNFGTKENRKGETVQDDRTYARVTYLGGTARTKKGGVVLPAKVGEEYTLWIGSTLKGKILEGMKYTTGPPPKMVGTEWNIWRGEEGQGGQRVYDAIPLGEPIPEVTVDEDGLMATLKLSIEKLGDIDHPTWYSFVKEQIKSDSIDEAKAFTERMADAGLLKVTPTKIENI